MHRTASSLLYVTIAVALVGCSTNPRQAPSVAILPLGAVPADELEAVRQNIERIHHVRSTVLPPKSLPASAFVISRDRYDASALLTFLNDQCPPNFARVLGVTERDIGVDRGNERASGIMGLAELNEKAGIVSTHRLSFGNAGLSLRTERLSRVAAHELGHTLGLPHCETPRCLMNDAHGAVATIDASTGELCWHCRRTLRSH